MLRIGLSSALLAYLFSKIDTAKMFETVKNADFRYMYFAAALFIFINFLLLLRWTVLVRALGLMVSFKSIANAFSIGLFFNLFLPSSTGGDIMKVVGLFKDTSEKAKVVASVVADRLSGFTSIVLVALVAFSFGFRLVNDHTLLMLIAILATLSGGIILVLFHERLFSLSCFVFNKLPKVKESLMRLHFAIVLLKGKPQALLSVVLFSSLSQVTLAFIFFLIAKSLHQDIKLIYFLIFVPLVCVISSLPSIGGLGFREGGAAYLFSKVGIESGVTVSISLVSFLFMVMMGLMGGVVYIVALSSKGSESYEGIPEVAPKKA